MLVRPEAGLSIVEKVIFSRCNLDNFPTNCHQNDGDNTLESIATLCSLKSLHFKLYSYWQYKLHRFMLIQFTRHILLYILDGSHDETLIIWKASFLFQSFQ